MEKISKNNLTISILKEINENDLRSIIEIEKENFNEGAVNTWFLAPFIISQKVIVAKYKEKIIGCSIFLKEFQEDCVFYFSLSLKKIYQKKGLGKFFFEQSVKKIFENYPNVNNIRYTVDPEKEFNVSFFQKYGITIEKSYHNFYEYSKDRLYVNLSRENFYEKISSF